MENAALFACPHNIHIHLVENLRVRFHGFRQAPAFFHIPQQLQHQLAHSSGLGDAIEQTQCLVDRHSRFNQGTKPAGEVQQIGIRNFLATQALGAGPGLLDLYRRQVTALQDSHGFALRFRVKLTVFNLAGLVESLIFEIQRTHKALVTLTTSSGVVMPALSFSRASCRRVRMPALIASSRMMLASAPEAIWWRISSLIISSS